MQIRIGLRKNQRFGEEIIPSVQPFSIFPQRALRRAGQGNHNSNCFLLCVIDAFRFSDSQLFVVVSNRFTRTATQRFACFHGNGQRRKRIPTYTLLINSQSVLRCAKSIYTHTRSACASSTFARNEINYFIFSVYSIFHTRIVHFVCSPPKFTNIDHHHHQQLVRIANSYKNYRSIAIFPQFSSPFGFVQFESRHNEKTTIYCRFPFFIFLFAREPDWPHFVFFWKKEKINFLMEVAIGGKLQSDLLQIQLWKRNNFFFGNRSINSRQHFERSSVIGISNESDQNEKYWKIRFPRKIIRLRHSAITSDTPDLLCSPIILFRRTTTTNKTENTRQNRRITQIRTIYTHTNSPISEKNEHFHWIFVQIHFQ